MRAKFHVTQISRQAGWSGHKEIHTVKLSPVSGNSLENKSFYAATPGGEISLSCVPDVVGNNFNIGQEFYVDFTPVPADAPVAIAA